MDEQQNSIDKLLHDMRERAKELNCLYQVEELLTKTHLPIAEIFTQLIHVIPAGYQFPEICQVGSSTRQTYRARTTPSQHPDRRHQDETSCRPHRISGASEVPQTENSYFQRRAQAAQTIAERIGRTILHLKLEQVSREWAMTQRTSAKNKKEWMVVIDLLRRTDQNLFIHLGRKMVYHLFWNGVMEAKELLKTLSKDRDEAQSELSDDMNRPSQRRSQHELLALSDETFRIAARYLTDKVSRRIQSGSRRTRPASQLRHQ
jgi:hypothetical protein